MIYAGWSRTAGVRVALKTTNGDEGGDSAEELQRSLEREFRILSGFSHPNIARVYEKFTLAHKTWFAMEMVEGVSCVDVIHRDPRWARGRFSDPAASFFRQLQSALDHIHERKIVYAGLAPWKLLIDQSGVLKLIDFEDCLDLGAGESPPEIMGNPSYFSPEHVAFDRPPLRIESDYFSVGTLLYECVTGKNPYSEGPFTAFRRLLGSDVDSLVSAIPASCGDLRALIASLWSQEPSARRVGWEMLREATRNAALVGYPAPADK